MATFPHWLHIYDKPALGNAFIIRRVALAYRHKISAMGWYDTASCDIAVSQKDGELFYENYLGNRVAIYVDNPAEPIWEGLITRITLEAGGVTVSHSLDNMFNRTQTVYRVNTDTTAAQNSAASNAASQAIYGIKLGEVEGFVTYTTALGKMNALRDMVLAFQAWPQNSLVIGGSANILHIEMQGFYHTLEWENVADTGVVNRTPTVLITQILALIANGTTFIENATTTHIGSGAVWTTAETVRDGQTVWQSIMDWTEPGDGVNRWISGVLPARYSDGLRLPYYRMANTDVEYIARVRDGMRFRNIYGGLIPAWTVKPDRGLRVNDILTGWNSQGDDPREIYIEAVDYDAESQMVTVTGVDDVTAEGAFQLKRYHKRHGERFGAQPRNSI